MLEFLDKHGMAQVQIRGGGIKAGLDLKRPAGFGRLFELGSKVFFVDDINRAPFNKGDLFFNCVIHEL